jgi:hypothetical protein
MRQCYAPLSNFLESPPLRYICGHKRFEQPAVIGDFQVQQFVHYHEILETGILVIEVQCERDRA